MKIQYPTNALKNYLDRNPTPVIKYYQGGAVGPHAITQRFNYTVTAGKRLLVCSLTAQMVVVTAAAPVGRRDIQFILNPGGAYDFLYECRFWKNAIGDMLEMRLTPMLVLPAANILAVYTTDGSTGGTVDYALQMTGFEFDA